MKVNNRAHVGSNGFKKIIGCPYKTTSNKLLGQCHLSFAITRVYQLCI